MVFLSLLFGFALGGSLSYVFWRLAVYWQTKYETLSQEARQRETAFVDEVCKARQIRPIGQSPVPIPAELPTLTQEQREILTDRLNERIEAGLMTASDAHLVLEQAITGQKTQAEIDRDLWMGRGSVLDDFA